MGFLIRGYLTSICPSPSHQMHEHYTMKLQISIFTSCSLGHIKMSILGFYIQSYHCERVTYPCFTTTCHQRPLNMAADYTGRRMFDYIVVGCGGIGSAALYWLSKRAKGGKT